MRRKYLAASIAAIAGCAAAGGGDDAPAVDGPPATIDGAPLDAGPDAEVPDAALVDASIEMRSFTDDTPGDFAGATLVDATIEPWGALAPVAYYTGGLLQRASDTGVFTDGATATWAQVTGFPATSKSAISWHSIALWGADTPPSV